MLFFTRFDRTLKNFLNVSCVLLSIAVTLLMVTEIVLRYVLNSSLRGLPEIYLLLVMWLYMLSTSMASANRSHLRIDIFSSMIRSSRFEPVYRLIISLVMLIIGLYFVRWAYGLFHWGLVRPSSTPILSIPGLATQSSIFVASLLVAGYSLRDVIRAGSDLLSRREKKARTASEESEAQKG